MHYMTDNKRTNVYIGAIYRCSTEDGKRIERYDTPKDAGQWVKDQNLSQAIVRVIANKITAHMGGEQKSAYGFIWKIDNDDLPDELWREVPDYFIDGHKNIYASSEGRIKRRNLISYGYIRKDDNYKVIGVGKKQYLVHRLMAFAFLPNFFGLPLVGHRDDNKLHNRLYNLKWCTHPENAKNAFVTGKHVITHNKPINQYDMNNNFIKKFHSAEEAGREINKEPSNIRKCCKGKYKKAFGFKWKYA